MALNYVNYNFDDMVTVLQDRLKNKDAWKDIYRSSTGQMLIELLAYILEQGLYYTERRAQESYLTTAKNRSSVINLVSLLNYVPKRQSSSVGVLTFTIDVANSKNIYIPKYTECESVDGYKFLTNESAAIEKGQTTVSVNSIQGSLVTINTTSNGSANQEFLINDTDVENSSDTTNPTIRVLVGGVEWILVSSFINSDTDDTHYRIVNNMEGTVSVIFGDGVNGGIPTNGASVSIIYVRTDGLDGNVTYTDKITTINDVIYDEDGTAVTGISVTNNGSFLGGDAEEGIDEIKYEAPRVFATGDRAVTRNDFIAILENYSGVANANVWGEKEEADEAGVDADYEMLNKVKISVILQEWELPDTDFKTVLSEYLYNNKALISVKYEFVTPVFLNVIPTLRVVVSTGHSLSQAQTDIDSVVEDEFILGDTTKLGTIIKYSEILSSIHDLDSVSYVTMDLEIKKELSDSYSSLFDWGEQLDAVDVKPESCRLYIDDVYVTTDLDGGSGTGTFSDAGGYTISGTVDYVTGVVNLDISPSASSVYIRYKQNKNGNIEPTFRQICKLDDVDILNIEMES